MADEDNVILPSSSSSMNVPLVEKGIKENPKGLPMEVQTEADIARDRHDYFNLLALVRKIFILRFFSWHWCGGPRFPPYMSEQFRVLLINRLIDSRFFLLLLLSAIHCSNFSHQL